MRPALRIKRGGTLTLACTLVDDGVAVPMPGWIISSQVRHQGQLVASLAVDYMERVGDYILTVTDTVAWPLGVLQCDIRYANSGGHVMHTRTFEIEIEEAVTR